MMISDDERERWSELCQEADQIMEREGYAVGWTPTRVRSSEERPEKGDFYQALDAELKGSSDKPLEATALVGVRFGPLWIEYQKFALGAGTLSMGLFGGGEEILAKTRFFASRVINVFDCLPFCIPQLSNPGYLGPQDPVLHALVVKLRKQISTCLGTSEHLTLLRATWRELLAAKKEREQVLQWMERCKLRINLPSLELLQRVVEEQIPAVATLEESKSAARQTVAHGQARLIQDSIRRVVAEVERQVAVWKQELEPLDLAAAADFVPAGPTPSLSPSIN